MIFDHQNIDFGQGHCHCSCQRYTSQKWLYTFWTISIVFGWFVRFAAILFTSSEVKKLILSVMLSLIWVLLLPLMQKMYNRQLFFFCFFFHCSILSFPSWLCFDSSWLTVHIPWAGNDRDCPWYKWARIPCYSCRQKWPVRAISFFFFSSAISFVFSLVYGSDAGISRNKCCVVYNKIFVFYFA